MTITRRVSITEAQALQGQGEWIDNPKYDPKDESPHAEPEKIFRGFYLIHWRPEPKLSEANQYALVTDLRE